MAKKDIKKLTPAVLEKQDKVLNGQRDFTVKINGQDYALSHDLIFRQSKKSLLLDDMVKFFQEATKNDGLLELATPYVTLLVFKHFTTLEVSDDVAEALDLLRVLIDLDVMNQIIVELPEDQLTSVYELLTNTINNMTENLEESEEEVRDLPNQIENDAVKELIPDVGE